MNTSPHGSPPIAQPDLHPVIAALPRPAGREDVFGVLDALGIGHSTLEHPATFSVDEGREIKATLPGGHTKNLFLKSKKGELVLVCALGDTSVRLNQLHKVLGTARLSFAGEALLGDTLNVKPGSVCVFALMNDHERAVRLVLDADLVAADPVNFHPMENTATTTISQAGMMAFIAATGRVADVVDFAQLGDTAGA